MGIHELAGGWFAACDEHTEEVVHQLGEGSISGRQKDVCLLKKNALVHGKGLESGKLLPASGDSLVSVGALFVFKESPLTAGRLIELIGTQ